ncbi:MAG TPA: glycosyltransferase family 4 protein [Patescibacteria group bacterium]|nr:glycosyltransferase family 4 protein [Patescibacteria group bacterium]
MLSFVWSDPLPLYSGRGGTETFTIGHIRELLRRGIPAQVLSYGLGVHDGREFFPDIPFHSIDSLSDLSDRDETIIFVGIPRKVPTKRQSFVFFHYPALAQHGSRRDYIRNVGKSKIITNSRFIRSYWADYLNTKERDIHVVYPFADPAFAAVKRKKIPARVTKVLFAARLSPEKGIYTLLEALHHPVADHQSPIDKKFTFTVTNAGNQTIHGSVIEGLLKNHPWVDVVSAKHSPEEMAELFSQYSVVVAPSNATYWHESFCMVSVEAQHAGCRVVATNADGLPESNCGEMIFFPPGDSFALSRALQKAAKLGALTANERAEAVKHFTLRESVDAFLAIIGKYAPL